jgi:CRISPR-associated endonuclease/helicase Cas3
MRDLPTFADFYQAVHGRPPFPWQSRLAAQVAERGWPDRIGVPTGLGKTSTIDIAVWSLAAQADWAPAERTAPTRVWYVVNRRLLVDAASDHVERLARILAQPDRRLDRSGAPTSPEGTDVLSAVADRLSSLCVGGTCELQLGDGSTINSPLFVSRLRGGAQAGRRPPHPAQPAVICSTVPMYGSRLLFRSYGSSNRMWPIEAALAGTDALVLLDEAHLAEPLRRAAQQATECDAPRTGVLRVPFRRGPAAEPERLVPPPRTYARIVALTATGESEGEVFDLDDNDLRHPVVQRRLSADKPTSLVETDVKNLPPVMAEQLVAALLGLPEPGAGVAFVNSPRTARGVKIGVEKAAAKAGLAAEVVVLTGQLRDSDADVIRHRLLDPLSGAPAGRPGRGRTCHLAVIATQTLEVGADVDFDVLVSETAGVRALTQRLGRLNRLGDRPHAVAILCHPKDRKPGGLYGTEPVELWERLKPLAQPLDLSPATIRDLLGPPSDALPRMPEMLPGHLWELVKTSTPPVGAAPPEVFFDGAPEPERTVSVGWRADLPGGGEPLVPALSAGELVDVPVGEVRAILTEAGWTALTLSVDGSSVDVATPEHLRPGQRLVFPTTAGCYGAHGWDPDERSEVLDLSPMLANQLHLTEHAIENLAGRSLDEELREQVQSLRLGDEDVVDPESDSAVGSAVLAWLQTQGARPELEPIWTRGQVEQWWVERISGGAVLRWQTPRRTIMAPRVDALDELSAASQGTLVELYPHMGAVGELAGRIAARLGLPDQLVRAVSVAGELHDLGKADARFQLWLGADPGSEPVAKSKRSLAQWGAGQARSGWPVGGRHELLSVQLIDAAYRAGVEWPETDLLRHLVLSHHGHGRPLCAIAGESAPLVTTARIGAMEVRAATDPSAPDWDQADRFRSLCERFGYWGLALLEAIVRQADHLVSAATEVE